ncbi:MAG: 3-phosphoshikimate 1-carboxyvinyltransferase [Pseudomonadota bacterium]
MHQSTDTRPQPRSASRSGPLAGEITVPGDKSISHRALLFGALATGVTKITGLLEAEDVLNTAKAVEHMGARVYEEGGTWSVTGCGVGGLSAPDAPLDFGNSGTGVRLMMGALAGHDFKAELIGDASLSRRPMGRVLNPLMQMGLEVMPQGADRLPLTIRGATAPLPMRYELPVPSAQVKSAVLLAGLHAPGVTTVVEREPTRDHTERMLRYFGAQIDVTTAGDATEISIVGEAELTGKPVDVPADPSSAAFLVAAAVITEGSDVTIKNVLLNPTRTGFYKTLQDMGADVIFENERSAGGEPVGDIRARSSRLKGVEVPASRAPSMIDEYPVLACVAAFATGTTTMLGLAELKVKESDRLAATSAGLTANGISNAIEGDTLKVHGSRDERPAGGGIVETHMDHRIAMAFLTLGLGSQAPVTVDDTRVIATSFPSFVDLMEGLGANLSATPANAGTKNPTSDNKGPGA